MTEPIPVAPGKKWFARISRMAPPLVRSLPAPTGAADTDSGMREVRLGVAILAVFFVGLGGWAALTPLDAAVTAHGVVTVSGHRQTVQHRDGGIVARLRVREGDEVAKGDVLIELASVELQSQQRALMSQVIELEATRARLLAELEGAQTMPPPNSWRDLPLDMQQHAAAVLDRQRRELRARSGSRQAQLDLLSERRKQLSARILGYEEQISALDRQEALIDEELTGVRALAEKGLAPLTRVRATERGKAELQGRRSDLRSQIEQLREAIGETRVQGIAVTQGRAESAARELREADSALAEVAPRVDAIRDALQRTLIRAPISGHVVGLKIFTEGGVIRPGEAILDVVPSRPSLVLEARVAPNDADDVRPGMRTEVRLPSLTGGHVPILSGEIERVSADRFTDERTGQAYFTAQVTVPANELMRLVDSLPKGTQLKPGLPAEVIIPLRARTALQYLVEPLDRQMWQSFREH